MRQVLAVAVAFPRVGDRIDGDTESELLAWSVSLSSDGSRMAVGALQALDGSTIRPGYARVYEWITDTRAWERLGDDLTSGEDDEQMFGEAVSLSSDGSRVAIGSFRSDMRV